MEGKHHRTRLFHCITTATLAAAAILLPINLYAQASDPAALAAVRGAVAAQLKADHDDKSNWIYRDHDVQGRDIIYTCVGSPQGELKRMIELGGHPVSHEEAQ